MNKIDTFRGKNFYLSNFYEVPVTYDGITYLNNEAAFQAMKLLDADARKSFAHLDPSSAKRKGRHVPLRNDWERVKDRFMYEICMAKFSQNEQLKEKLIHTMDSVLEEGNDWGEPIGVYQRGVARTCLERY